MRKFSHLDTLDQPRQPVSKISLAIFCLLLLVAAIPLFELGKLGLTRFGLLSSSFVNTPVLDWLSYHWEERSGEFRDWITPFLVNRRWNPRVVLPVAFGWTALAVWLLRKGHA